MNHSAENHSDEQQGCDERMRLLDRLIDDFEQKADPATRDLFGEVLRTILEIHSAGLQRTLDLIADSGCATELIHALAAEPAISSMLIVHDLHPHDLQTRVGAALDRARPYLASHGGEVELVRIDPEGLVHLRLQGSCHGCAGSRATLASLIEQGIYAAAPDVSGVVVDGLADDSPLQGVSGFVPLKELRVSHSPVQASGAGI